MKDSKARVTSEKKALSLSLSLRGYSRKPLAARAGVRAETGKYSSAPVCSQFRAFFVALAGIFSEGAGRFREFWECDAAARAGAQVQTQL